MLRCLGVVLLAVGCLPDPLPADTDTDPVALPPGAPGDQPDVPVYGGTLASSHGTLVVADPGWDRITIVSDGLTVERTVSLRDGAEPFRIVIDDGVAFVTLRGSGELATLDVASATVLSQTEVCGEPRGVAVDGDDVFVACAGGVLHQLTRSLDPVRSAFVDSDLRDVIVQDDVIWLSRFREAQVLRLDRDTLEEAERATPNLGRVDQPLAEPRVGWRLRAHPSGQGVVLMHLAQSTEPIVLDDERTSNAYAGDLCRPDTLRSSLHFTHVRANLSPVSGRAVSSGGPGYDFVFDDDRILVPLASPDPSAAPGLPFANTRVAEVTVEQALSGLDCLMAITEYRSEAAGVVTSVGVVDRRVVAYVRDPSEWKWMVRTELTDTAPPTPTAFRTFHTAQPAGLACASCHPEGQDDAHVWHFEGLGPRRTQNLAGGLASRAPFHWDGEFPELDDLMGDVFEVRMGGPTVDEALVDEMADWLDGIPTLKVDVDVDPDVVDQGRALFTDAAVGCAGCHTGPQFSDFTLHVVREGGDPTKTPSLLGVGTRAPYMHDGCAPTLIDRFIDPACGGGDRHGRTSHLDDAQIAALVAYLQTL